MIEIRHYLTPTGQDLFQLWLNELKDSMGKARVLTRLSRLSAGVLGDCKPVGSSVWELRIDHGPGYRIYYARAGEQLVLLLLGADKRKQQADIAKAIKCWKDYQQRTS